MTLDDFLAELKGEHGDKWVKEAIWTIIVYAQSVRSLPKEDRDLSQKLFNWLESMITAGITATAEIERLKSDLRISETRRAEASDGWRNMTEAYQEVLRKRDATAHPQQVAWEPVPDGTLLATDGRDESVSARIDIGDAGAYLDISTHSRWVNVRLPDGVRLCRQVQRPQAQPVAEQPDAEGVTGEG